MVMPAKLPSSSVTMTEPILKVIMRVAHCSRWSIWPLAMVIRLRFIISLSEISLNARFVLSFSRNLLMSRSVTIPIGFFPFTMTILLIKLACIVARASFTVCCAWRVKTGLENILSLKDAAQPDDLTCNFDFHLWVLKNGSA